MALLWAIAAFLLFRARSLLNGVLGVLPLLGALAMVAIYDAMFYTELWAGLCIWGTRLSRIPETSVSPVSAGPSVAYSFAS